MPGLSDAVRVIEPGKTRSIVAPPIDSPDAKAGQRRIFRYKRGCEKRNPAEKREYVRHCRPPDISIAEGRRLMGLAAGYRTSAFLNLTRSRRAQPS